MRRFFKSAAFPILLVVILAFIAQRVITSDSGDKAPSYNEIVNEKTGLIAQGKIEEVSVNVKDSSLDIKQQNGESYLHRVPAERRTTPDAAAGRQRRDDEDRSSTAPAARDCSRCSPTCCPSSSSSASGSS